MTIPTAWTLIAAAIVIEVAATSLLTQSRGFSRLLPGLGSLALYAVSFYILSQTLRVLPVGIVYAVWSGCGIVLISLVGSIAFRQALDWPAVAGIALIVAGVLLVNLSRATVGH